MTKFFGIHQYAKRKHSLLFVYSQQQYTSWSRGIPMYTFLKVYKKYTSVYKKYTSVCKIVYIGIRNSTALATQFTHPSSYHAQSCLTWGTLMPNIYPKWYLTRLDTSVLYWNDYLRVGTLCESAPRTAVVQSEDPILVPHLVDGATLSLRRRGWTVTC